ncbi:MAG: hypothetical protein GX075_05915 [Firmicutes bacterium]|nr:hypothetical protein [Bacillota bacterium]
MEFIYKAANASGLVETGRLEAASGDQLVTILKNKGLIPLEIKPATGSGLNPFKKRFSRKERLTFTRQLAGLLNAGVGLEKALAIISRLSFSREMNEIISQILRLLHEGHSFTAALEKFPRYFNPLYVSMIKAGEAGGILPKVLNRLIRYLEEELNLRNYVISSLIYPSILGFASLGVLLLYVIVVIPTFEPIFADLGNELPLITRMVMFLGKALQYFWWVFLLLAVGCGLWIWKWTRTEEGGLKFDRLKLTLPLLGNVLTKIAISRMSLSLSMLCGSGVPLLTAFSIAGNVSGNSELNRVLKEVIQEVRQGSTLVASMSNKSIFPALAVEMFGVGEESGNLEEMLQQVAGTYESEVRQSLSVFLAVFEPFLILFMVGVIGILAIAILVPIFNLNSQIDPMG